MQKVTLKASGSQAPTDMPPGEWVARCERGEIKVRGSQISAVLSFSVLGRFTEKGFVEENAGVVLKQWYFLSKTAPGDEEIVLEIQPHSKYGIAWALAMGRPLRASDRPDPIAFQKKIFRVDVGYRSDAGGSFSYKNQGRKKDPKDFLRIHSIVEKVEEKALSHMTPYGPNGASNNVNVTEHVDEHEHDTRASTVTSTTNKSIRSSGISHMSNEPVPQGHANLAPGLSEDMAPAGGKPGITSGDVLRVFPGAKVVEKPAEQQFQLLKSARRQA